MINEAIRKIKSLAGYKILRNPEHNYFHVVTPKGNVLYFQHGEYGGLVAVLEYVPSRTTGTGCQCNEDAFNADELTATKMQELERDGLAFAKELHAKFYANAEEWRSNYWDKANLVEA